MGFLGEREWRFRREGEWVSHDPGMAFTIARNDFHRAYPALDLRPGLSKDEFVQMKAVIYFALVLGLLGCLQVNLPMEYLLPENYVGWVSLQCSVAGAPPLQLIDGRLQAPVPPNGRARTSSHCKAGLRSVQYWYVDVSKRRVRELFTERPGEISRVTAIGSKPGNSEMSGVVFWVGPQPSLKELETSYQALIDTLFRDDSKQP
jgi:hypothetical protein